MPINWQETNPEIISLYYSLLNVCDSFVSCILGLYDGDTGLHGLHLGAGHEASVVLSPGHMK